MQHAISATKEDLVQIKAALSGSQEDRAVIIDRLTAKQEAGEYLNSAHRFGKTQVFKLEYGDVAEIIRALKGDDTAKLAVLSNLEGI